MRFEAEGFERQSRRGINLRDHETIRVDVVLRCSEEEPLVEVLIK